MDKKFLNGARNDLLSHLMNIQEYKNQSQSKNALVGLYFLVKFVQFGGRTGIWQQFLVVSTIVSSTTLTPTYREIFLKFIVRKKMT